VPLLTLRQGQANARRWQFPEMAPIRIGTESGWSDLLLPEGAGIAPRHAVIERAALNRLLMVIDLHGAAVAVNDHPVTQLRVLRQGDVLRVGECALVVWEVQIRALEPGDPAVGRRCPVSRRELVPGDEIIACPGCGTVHLRDAWMMIEHCAAGCGYPNRLVVMETLSREVQLARSLDEDSDLVETRQQDRVIQGGKHCQAGFARDHVPFQKGQNVAFCPGCATPFHLECFLTMPECPVCKFDSRGLVDRLMKLAPEPEVEPPHG